MPDLNIFKIDIGNLAKLSRKGKIVKVYRAMYREGERLAVKELKLFMSEMAVTKYNMSALKGVEMIFNYRKDRIAYHMDEMKKLLEISLKEQSKEE
jgi:hypothetical protein